MIFVEFGYRGFERQFTAGNLKFLDQVGSAGKQDAPAIFDQRKADCGCQMGFTPTRWTKEDEVGAFFEPAITRTQRRHPGAGDHWHCIEGEAVESLARWQAGFAQMPFDPASVPFCDLMLSERRKQAGPRPAFLVCPRGKVGPDQFDCWQAQVVEDEAQTLGVDSGCVPAHAASPARRTS